MNSSNQAARQHRQHPFELLLVAVFAHHGDGTEVFFAERRAMDNLLRSRRDEGGRCRPAVSITGSTASRRPPASNSPPTPRAYEAAIGCVRSHPAGAAASKALVIAATRPSPDGTSSKPGFVQY
jgi:hypothetical protein